MLFTPTEGSYGEPAHREDISPAANIPSDDTTHCARGDCCAGSTSVLSPQATVIDAPTALPADQVRSRLYIAQMDCPTEEGLIRDRLGDMAAVHNLEFNLIQQVLTVVHRPGALPAITAAIGELGLDAAPMTDATTTELSPAEAAVAPWWPLAVSGVAALAAEIAHWVGWPDWIAAALALIAIVISGIGVYQKGWIALRHGNLNINALMSVAVTGALLLQQWPEAAMVMVLFAIAERIEAQSLDRARNAIRGLLQLTPEQATVRQADGHWLAQPAKTVAIGQLVRVKPGERIALDGVVTTGRSSVDQAPITGESLPVAKEIGDSVFAGTINQAGSFEYRVVAEAGHSTLARIIQAIEEAQSARAPTQRFIDQFAKIYTPAVFLLAVAAALIPPLMLGGGWYDWVYRALVLLVIACPCALVISTPVTIVSGLAAAARRGILIKGGVHLEQGRALRWLALDKTGTLTHGKPALTDYAVLDARIEQARALAASLAAHSDHPVSQAIAAAQPADWRPAPVTAFSALAGRGVQGVIDGREYRLGSHRLIHDLGLCSEQLEAQLGALEQQGKTAVLLADQTGPLALFGVADTVKDSSRQAIAELHALGVRTVMLSGDNPHTAQAIAAQVGIDQARGNQLPQDKADAIAALVSPDGKVGMVGDGINDAPALARADIGFAMGALGADTAIETADVALMDDDLRKIPAFVRLSQATHRILFQNIALALGIKAVFLILTVAGLGTMWMAVFADMGASLLVVFNGLRLLRS